MLSRMSWNIAAQCLGLLSGLLDRFLLTGLMIRVWGLDAFADWSVVTSAAALFGVCELGMQLHFLNLMQAAHVKADRDAFDHAFGLATFCYAVAALVFCAAVPLALWGANTWHWFGTRAFAANETAVIFVAMALSAVIAVVRAPYASALMARGHFPLAITMGTLTSMAMVVACIGALWAGASPSTVAVIQCAVMGPFAVLLLYGADRRNRSAMALGAASGYRIPTAAEAASIASHVKWYAVQQVGPIVQLQLPVTLMTGFGVETRALAAFILIRTLINMTRQLTMVISSSTGVEIASVMHGDAAGNGKAWAATQRVGWAATTAAAVFAPAILLFGARFVEVWTKRNDVFDLALTAWLLLPVVATIPLQQVATHLQFAGSARLVGGPRFAQLLATIPCGWFGLKLGGTLGLAMALAAIEIVTQWWIVPHVARRADFPGLAAYLRRCFSGMAALMAISTLAAAVSLLALPRNANPMLGLIAPGCLWALLIAGPLFWAMNPGNIRARVLTYCRPRTSA
jgi:hypothetical protein